MTIPSSDTAAWTENLGELTPCPLNQERVLASKALHRLNFKNEPIGSAIVTAIALEGRVQDEWIRRSLAEITRRHAGLRISIIRNPSLSPEEFYLRLRRFGRTGIVQNLHSMISRADACNEFSTEDLAGIPADAIDAEIQSWCQKEATRAFEDAKYSLLRAKLLRLSSERYVLLVCVDHLVSDRRSENILYQEFQKLYAHFSMGCPLHLDLPKWSYVDYATWQAESCRAEYFEKHRTYWLDQWRAFGGDRIALNDLPFFEHPQNCDLLCFKHQEVQLESGISSEIRKAARGCNTTLHSLILTSLAITLRHYTKKTRLAIWGHFANRTRAETADTIGFFVHTHLMGINLADDPLVLDLVRQVNATVLQGVRFQDMPLPDLWASLNCSPMYSDAGILFDSKTTMPSESGKSVSRWPIRASLPRLSRLGIYLADDGECIRIWSAYQSPIFSDEAVKQLLQDIQEVASEFARVATRRVSDFSSVGDRYKAYSAANTGEMSDFLIHGSGRLPALGVSGNPI